MKSYPKITDINKCEDEPIHLIPNVQQFGCLLVLDYKDTIIQCSNNTIDILNIAEIQIVSQVKSLHKLQGSLLARRSLPKTYRA